MRTNFERKVEIIKKIVSVSGKVLMWLIVALVAFFIALTLSQNRSNDGLANLLGYSPLTIQSNSMKGDLKENFQKGDLIIVKALTEDGINNLKVGEIIVFRDVIEGRRMLNSHRIIEIIDESGRLSFVTKGDNNPVPDEVIRESYDIIAIYKGGKVAKAGTAMDFLNSKWGFFICLVIPLALFFIRCVYKLYVAYKAYKDFDEEEEKAAQDNANVFNRLLEDANIDPTNVDSSVLAVALAKFNATNTEETEPVSDC